MIFVYLGISFLTVCATLFNYDYFLQSVGIGKKDKVRSAPHSVWSNKGAVKKKVQSERPLAKGKIWKCMSEESIKVSHERIGHVLKTNNFCHLTTPKK